MMNLRISIFDFRLRTSRCSHVAVAGLIVTARTAVATEVGVSGI
jgi:hypothetical protein